MKSERRHELQHNELADWIIKTGKAVQPYQNLLLAVVVIAVVGATAYTWWSRTTVEQTARAWDELNSGLATALGGGGTDKLSTVVDKYQPDSNVGRTAAVVLADFRLASGCNQRFMSKALAEPELSKAIELYEADLKEGHGEFLLERATFGLARAQESKGDLPSARQRYGEVVKKWPHGAYSAVAKQRLHDLERGETKLMYDDFAKFDHRPNYATPSSPSGLALPPGELPGLPSEPAIEPNTQPDSHPAAGTKPVADKKPADNKKPVADKKPVSEKKPAESKKPADNKKP
jgi:hypothetical protein